MPNNYRQILSAISTNSWTALVTSIDGSVYTIRVDFDLESDLLLQFMKNVAKKYGECAISLKPQKQMTESELEKEINETLRVLRLNNMLDAPETFGKEILSELDELNLRIIAESADGREVTIIGKPQPQRREADGKHGLRA